MKLKKEGETTGRDIRELNLALGTCKQSQDWMDRNSHMSPKEMWEQYEDGAMMLEYCSRIGVDASFTIKTRFIMHRNPRAQWANIVRANIPYEVVRAARRKYVKEHS